MADDAAEPGERNPLSPNQAAIAGPAGDARRERGPGRPLPSPLPAADGVRRVGDLLLDPEQWCAWRDGQDLRLTRTEFALLWALAATPGQPCSREQLSRQVWGSPDTGNTNLVAVCIRRLRRKLEPDPTRPIYIQTVRNKGYVLYMEPDPTPEHP